MKKGEKYLSTMSLKLRTGRKERTIPAYCYFTLLEDMKDNGILHVEFNGMEGQIRSRASWSSLTRRIEDEHLTKGKLYFINNSVEMLKTIPPSVNMEVTPIGSITAGDVVMFLGYHPSRPYVYNVLAGELVGWISIRPENIAPFPDEQEGS